MGAPKGNTFWKLRSKHGRDRLFETPQLLWEAACEYFTWCDKHPWYRNEQAKNPGKGVIREDGKVFFPPAIVKIPTARPYTLHGLCLYLDANTFYLIQFEKSIEKKEDELSKDFSQVLTRIREIIFQQKFEGAAIGAFNASIIARDLGLAEKKEVNLTSETELFIGKNKISED